MNRIFSALAFTSDLIGGLVTAGRLGREVGIDDFILGSALGVSAVGKG